MENNQRPLFCRIQARFPQTGIFTTRFA